jgi:hypothetical protein
VGLQVTHRHYPVASTLGHLLSPHHCCPQQQLFSLLLGAAAINGHVEHGQRIGIREEMCFVAENFVAQYLQTKHNIHHTSWIQQLHCTALHCTALHCTALHCTALHCTALNLISCNNARTNQLKKEMDGLRRIAQCKQLPRKCEMNVIFDVCPIMPFVDSDGCGVTTHCMHGLAHCMVVMPS